MKTAITELFGIAHPIIQCGMVVGLINDILACKELIERTMSQAENLISQRLRGMTENTSGTSR